MKNIILVSILNFLLIFTSCQHEEDKNLDTPHLKAELNIPLKRPYGNNTLIYRNEMV